MVLTLDQELLDGIRQVVREEISGVKDDVSSLKSDVSSLKSDVSSLKSDVSTLKTDVSEMKPQLEENTNIVRALLANSEEHGAKFDQLEHRVSRLEGTQKRQGELEAYLKDHHHEIVIETGKPVFNN
ncbi:MAG: hypothetical protein UMU04_09050 [Halanaerobiales bacterium]|nr:hypothetical protein [Halanaerobiales bacterium]